VRQQKSTLINDEWTYSNWIQSLWDEIVVLWVSMMFRSLHWWVDYFASVFWGQWYKDKDWTDIRALIALMITVSGHNYRRLWLDRQRWGFIRSSGSVSGYSLPSEFKRKSCWDLDDEDIIFGLWILNKTIRERKEWFCDVDLCQSIFWDLNVSKSSYSQMWKYCSCQRTTEGSTDSFGRTVNGNPSEKFWIGWTL